MSGVEALMGLAGRWEGRTRLWMTPDTPASESPTAATIAASIRAKFLRMDYTWVEPEGEPQDGAMIIAFAPSKGTSEIHWTDSWHYGHGVMVLQGTLGPDGAVAVLGSYPAPTGPDWGWSIELHPPEGRSLRMTMHNIMPGGKPMLAVEAIYSRTE